MADPTQFSHDQLGHLLADRLLKVPPFQRRFSWLDEHVSEYWDDIQRARAAGNLYFMGTIVLASDSEGDGRQLIIDGQQRITTTAILFVAIRDRLYELDQEKAAQSIDNTHLSNYVLTHEETVARLTLSPDDHSAFSDLLDRSDIEGVSDPVLDRYRQLKGYVDELTPSPADYRGLIALVDYLNTEVQVLVAVATGLAEAYVIFETLNDRGADLTTADLLKNFLFSQAGTTGISQAQSVWTRLNGRFDKPDDFVKFIRYEYMSRNGRVTNRALYKALQSDIGVGASAVRAYVDGLERSLQRYVALREPDDASWSSQAIEVKDSLLAFRRFGFESSTPLLLAAFASWSHGDATRFVDVVAAWSVRAWMAGTLGGGVAENAFCEGAVAIMSERAKTVDDVRPFMKDIVPDDGAFRQAFMNYGAITTTRAKYLLAQLERQRLVDDGQSTDAMPDWSSKSVSVEHIFARSSKRSAFDSDQSFEQFSIIRDQLQNLALLERTLNNDLADGPFPEKRVTYRESAFALTNELGNQNEWTLETSAARASELAELAVKAWPV
jgi:hypothetical protein